MFLSKKSVQKKVALLPIDFTQPWWSLILEQKWLFIIISLITIVVRIFWSISPFLIAKVFEVDTVAACMMLFLTWIFIDCINTGRRRQILDCAHS